MMINKVGELLESYGLTSYGLAKQAGLKTDVIYRLIKDQTALPAITTLTAICETLNCQPNDVIEYIPDHGTEVDWRDDDEPRRDDWDDYEDDGDLG